MSPWLRPFCLSLRNSTKRFFLSRNFARLFHFRAEMSENLGEGRWKGEEQYFLKEQDEKTSFDESKRRNSKNLGLIYNFGFSQNQMDFDGITE